MKLHVHKPKKTQVFPVAISFCDRGTIKENNRITGAFEDGRTGKKGSKKPFGAGYEN